jgi:8-amino-7-oxononanoate synthase
MELIAAIDRQLAAIAAQGLTRRRRTADTACAPHQIVDGRAMLAFCANDYLGLAAHPAIVAALQEGAKLYGAGSGASHLVSGHGRAHAQFETAAAAFMAPHIPNVQALYLCTGYMANLAVLTALGADKDAMIFSEALNHASLIDGARLARAGVTVYAHGDVAMLETQLATSTATTKIVVTDSVFSMDGDLAPLPDLLALCERHGAWLVVDDAHGFGILGDNGRGALEHFNLSSPHLVYVGTLGKAAGVGGAFIAAHASVIELLVQRARPYIYTTAAPPALAHALLTSLDIIGGAEGKQRRQHLARLVTQFDEALSLQRWQRVPSTTPVQAIIIGGNDEAMAAAASLHAQGLWVPAIRPPTVPANTARLRVTLSAAHTEDDVAQLAAALNTLEGNAP